MARTALKVCCIASVEEAMRAIAHGAGWLGLVSAMPSGPGVIDEASIARIAAAVPAEIRTVLLTALTDAEAVADQQARLGTAAVQLVASPPADELRRLRRLRPGLRLIPVVHVEGDEAIEQARSWVPWSDAVLLDSGRPGARVPELGGTGRTHDWTLSARLVRAIAPHPVFLAGGLRADNLRQALRTVRPFGIDVCSGVRRADRLDTARLAALAGVLAGFDGAAAHGS